jgi:hypothetical protein
LDPVVTADGPRKRLPGETNAQHDDCAVDPNIQFIEAGSRGGLGWGATDNAGYQPLLVRLLRALARRRDKRSDD